LWQSRLPPIGIFVLTAAAAGTLHVHEISRLQIYLWVYIATWILLAVFTLPMLVARAIPFTYSEVFREAWMAMMTAFATETVLVVLPMVAQKTKELLSKRDLKSESADSAIDILVPTAYSFPSVGILVGIRFILFASWFIGAPLIVAEYPPYA